MNRDGRFCVIQEPVRQFSRKNFGGLNLSLSKSRSEPECVGADLILTMGNFRLASTSLFSKYRGPVIRGQIHYRQMELRCEIPANVQKEMPFCRNHIRPKSLQPDTSPPRPQRSRCLGFG